MSEPRLKQVEILLESCAKVAVNNQTDIRSLIEQNAQNQRNINSLIQQSNQNQSQIITLTQQMASLSDMFSESIQVMKAMQLEIKGLQTENKRILDHLFGENQN